MTTPLATALDYAALGLAVFPCLIGTKEPATRRGFYDATTNPATLRRWFGSQQSYNIAVATGLASGVWVLDADGEAGAVTLGNLEAKHGALPSTRTSISSAGCHLWWRAVGELQSSTARIGPGLDVRGDGGYIMAPPSIHPDGPVYRWSNETAPVPAPEWLLRLARKRPPPPAIPPRQIARTHSCDTSSYAKAALEYEIGTLASTPQGQRNHALNRASFSLHQLVAGGELDGAEVERCLLDAATANGLMTDPHDGPRKVWATIQSGARAGLQNPRSRPIGGRT
jgi:hypothetical protein